jgi:hypothetical protein
LSDVHQLTVGNSPPGPRPGGLPWPTGKAPLVEDAGDVVLHGLEGEPGP